MQSSALLCAKPQVSVWVAVFVCQTCLHDLASSEFDTPDYHSCFGSHRDGREVSAASVVS